MLVAGTVLVATGEAIATQTSLGSSFVGATLIASTTSLPELSTTIGAVRLRAYSMAFANIFGSNAIMVALLFLTDVVHRDGPILELVDRSAAFAATVGIVAELGPHLGQPLEVRPGLVGAPELPETGGTEQRLAEIELADDPFHGALERPFVATVLVVVDELREMGIVIRSPSSRGVAEEAPGAYKDVGLVVDSAEHAGLARKVAFLRPMICIKG